VDARPVDAFIVGTDRGIVAVAGVQTAFGSRGISARSRNTRIDSTRIRVRALFRGTATIGDPRVIAQMGSVVAEINIAAGRRGTIDGRSTTIGNRGVGAYSSNARIGRTRVRIVTGVHRRDVETTAHRITEVLRAYVVVIAIDRVVHTSVRRMAPINGTDISVVAIYRNIGTARDLVARIRGRACISIVAVCFDRVHALDNIAGIRQTSIPGRKDDRFERAVSVRRTYVRRAFVAVETLIGSRARRWIEHRDWDREAYHIAFVFQTAHLILRPVGVDEGVDAQVFAIQRHGAFSRGVRASHRRIIRTRGIPILFRARVQNGTGSVETARTHARTV
jgi:hypothetical protein